VNLITRPAWSLSGQLSGTDAGELTSRGLVQVNSLRVKGFKRISYWSMALPAGLPSGSASRPGWHEADRHRVGVSQIGPLDQAKRYCLGLA
jgi:hypothetical protein